MQPSEVLLQPGPNRPGVRTALIAAFAWWFIVSLGEVTWRSFGLFPPRTRGDFVKNQLIQQKPRILVRSSGPDGIRVNAGTLAEGQEMAVATQLRAVLIDNAD